MTTEPNTPKNDAIEAVQPEIVDESSTITRPEPPKDAQSSIQEETTALIEAIRTKAFSEAQKAGEFARDNYLEAVRKARQDIESRQLFDPERIEEAIKQIQKEVEKDWDSVVKEVTGFGDRLNEAAKAAWDILTAPKEK
ncbi:conserved hypothetical protein [Rippkaea orientalis PCC 8801]|uniref:Uncharacterized protein n=1 Tax=Rippkaea orientalis (strain PCC 8801 / RF-1) TaxID=41431 RepID=B7JWQ7_RIPO1|nr:hypothetical protein [Rippkaea orientalis]ACK64703.1 conserved hypothetical protein [Rippkaea orientalis PCC 8801]